jgi:NitT/TauT family transport system ATP-binding protein
VTKTFGESESAVTALLETTTRIAAGEFVSIVGPSGCGKSTLLRITAGLIAPTTGVVELNGKVVAGTQTDIGIVFQYPVLLPWKRAIQNILFQIEMRGLKKSDYMSKAEELIELVGLRGFEQRYPSELSGGMQHRVSLCRALIHDPPVLLMDEPFASLDAMTRDQMNTELLKICQRKKKTILFVTHSIPEAVFLSNRVLVMSARPGRIIEDVPIEFGGARTEETRDTMKFVEYARMIRSTVGKFER